MATVMMGLGAFAAASPALAASAKPHKPTPSISSQTASAPAKKAAAGGKNSGGGRPTTDARLEKAYKLAASGQYQEASKLYFQLSRLPEFEKDSAQIKYILGMMLFEMKLNQSAAFVFYDVVRQESRANPKSKYLHQSLEKLTLAADALDSDVLLRYAIKQINPDEFPQVNRDMLAFRAGELNLDEKKYSEAAKEFSRIRPGSTFYRRARYNLGLAYAEAGDAEKAQGVFEELAAQYTDVTDHGRVSALLGKARALYQRGQFEAAIEAYREIPRDTEHWHEALFESSWAMLRDGRFRSALSNFHSLHSDFYEGVYQPESLYLRALVYLYICRYDELEKVLDLFESIYKPVQRDIRTMLSAVKEPGAYYKEIAKASANFEALRSGAQNRKNLQIPFIAARQILKEGDVRRSFGYLSKLEAEGRIIASMPASWRTSSIGKYAAKIVEKRAEATRNLLGRQVRRHLMLILGELNDLLEQDGYLRFETLAGRKEALRKEIAGKGIERPKVDEDTNRQFYIQNGYEYWPFKGEYWLDEIGNYHYVGVKACE
jgi:TolA-binding protein